MPTNPSHHNLDAHTRYIRALNGYFLTVPVRHFDKQEKLVFFSDIYVSAVSLLYLA